MPDEAAFSAAFSGRPVRRSQHFVLYLHENGLQQARLGLTFGKRFCKRASERNLLKRVAREIFRQQLPFLAAVDILLRLHSSFPRTEVLSRRALKMRCYAEFNELIARARIANFKKRPEKGKPPVGDITSQ